MVGQCNIILLADPDLSDLKWYRKSARIYGNDRINISIGCADVIIEGVSPQIRIRKVRKGFLGLRVHKTIIYLNQ